MAGARLVPVRSILLFGRELIFLWKSVNSGEDRPGDFRRIDGVLMVSFPSLVADITIDHRGLTLVCTISVSPPRHQKTKHLLTSGSVLAMVKAIHIEDLDGQVEVVQGGVRGPGGAGSIRVLWSARPANPPTPDVVPCCAKDLPPVGVVQEASDAR